MLWLPLPSLLPPLSQVSLQEAEGLEGRDLRVEGVGTWSS